MLNYHKTTTWVQRSTSSLQFTLYSLFTKLHLSLVLHLLNNVELMHYKVLNIMFLWYNHHVLLLYMHDHEFINVATSNRMMLGTYLKKTRPQQ